MNTTNHQTEAKTTTQSAPLSAREKKAAKTRAFRAALTKEFHAIGNNYRRACQGLETARLETPLYKKLQAAARLDFDDGRQNSKKALRFYYQVPGGSKVLVKYRIMRFSGVAIEPPRSFIWTLQALNLR